MLALRSPQEAYRRVQFDARIETASAHGLVALCFEQLDSALASASIASESRDNAAKSRALTRALSAITALQLGIEGEHGVAGALRTFYEAARRTLLDNAIAFDPAALAALRGDFADIARALAEGGRTG
jgi:flagellin-specific chaperone FliS